IFWTIPGTVLVGQSLTHLTFHQVVGAFYVTSVLMLVLGATGSVKRAMELVPLPIVMGMVAGVFLRFGLDLSLPYSRISPSQVRWSRSGCCCPRSRGSVNAALRSSAQTRPHAACV